MSGIPALPSFNLWKLGAGAALVVALIISAVTIKLTIENRQLGRQSADLSKQINDPETGYIARLRTSENNVILLKGAIVRQNAAYAKLSKESTAELNRLRAELAKAEREAADLRKRAAALMSRPIKGNTLEERVLDVDNKVLEDLKK